MKGRCKPYEKKNKYNFKSRNIEFFDFGKTIKIRGIRNEDLFDYEILVPLFTKTIVNKFKNGTTRIRLKNQAPESEFVGMMYEMHNYDHDTAIERLKLIVSIVKYVDIFLDKDGKVCNVVYCYMMRWINYPAKEKFICLKSDKYKSEDFLLCKNY